MNADAGTSTSSQKASHLGYRQVVLEEPAQSDADDEGELRPRSQADMLRRSLGDADRTGEVFPGPKMFEECRAYSSVRAAIGPWAVNSEAS